MIVVRICVITAGHLSTSPRMLKAADALVFAGHDVRVVSTLHVDWATTTDEEIRAKRRWRSTIVDYRTGSRERIVSGARHRAAHAIASAIGPRRVPYAIAARAFSRMHDELVAAALAAPADFFYGGTTGGLPATAAAAQARRVPFGVDVEDFYRGQHDEPDGRVTNGVAARVEQRVLPAAACVTAASAGIAAEYARVAEIAPVVVNNTFPLPPRAPEFDAGDSAPLRFYWFSQTVGAQRGLEEVIRGIGLAAVPATLTLRGRAVPGYPDTLVALARDVAPQLALSFVAPASPDAMVDACRPFDIGLAVEQPTTRNREICLSNKALTYILAGLAVVFTDTAGHRLLAHDLAEGAFVYPVGQPGALAAGIRRWACDRRALAIARRAAWSAAVRRWHWEHPMERGALIAAIERAAA